MLQSCGRQKFPAIFRLDACKESTHELISTHRQRSVSGMATMKTYEVTIIDDGKRKQAKNVQAITSYGAANNASGSNVKRFMGREENGSDMFLMRSGVLVVVVEV